MSSLQPKRSAIKDVLLTTPAGQAACLLRSGLARVGFQRDGKRSPRPKPDLEYKGTLLTLTAKGPTVAILDQDFPVRYDEVSPDQSQTDTISLSLAGDWPMTKRVYTVVVICLYT